MKSIKNEGIFNDIIYGCSNNNIVIGGTCNLITIGDNQGIFCGRFNKITNGINNVICGGNSNIISSNGSGNFIAGGWPAAGNIISYGFASSIIGGVQSGVSARYSSVIGGKFNNCNGGSSVILGGESLSILSSGGVIAGGWENKLLNNSFNSFIAGGIWNTINNTTNGGKSSIITGQSNRISGASSYCGIFCGVCNRISDSLRSCISSGISNKIISSGNNNFIGAGKCNIISSNASNSVCFGSFTNNSNSGSFLFGDGSSLLDTATCLTSINPTTPLTGRLEGNTNNVWKVLASGGAVFYSNTTKTTGVVLLNGSGGWASVSSKYKKENFESVDKIDILEKLCSLEICEWNYKDTPENIKHISPFAEDFYDAFKLGQNPSLVETIDFDGIALASIQGLNMKFETLKKDNETLKKDNETLKKDNETLKKDNETLVEKYKKMENEIMEIKNQLYYKIVQLEPPKSKK